VYYVLGLSAVQVGNLCCVLLGASVLFVLQPTGTMSEYQIIGECYIQGVMRGEAV